jgi:hypothetical protein
MGFLVSGQFSERNSVETFLLTRTLKYFPQQRGRPEKSAAARRQERPPERMQGPSTSSEKMSAADTVVAGTTLTGAVKKTGAPGGAAIGATGAPTHPTVTRYHQPYL